MKISLKTLCVTIGLLSTALGVLSWPITAYTTQARIAHWVESNGGRVTWRHDSIFEVPIVTIVDMNFAKVTSIEILGDAVYLEHLNLSGTKVKSLKPISGLRRLQSLRADGAPIMKLDSTHLWLPAIESLGLSNTSLTELAGVEECRNLKYLNLSGTKIQSFAFSRQHRFPRLSELEISDSPVKNLDGLNDCPNLEYVDISNTRVSDISAIGNCRKLEHLRMSSTAVIDFSPILKLDRLVLLKANNTNFSDGKLLKHLKLLDWIELSGTGLTDVSWISGRQNMLYLDISFTKVNNTDPLKSIHAASLNLQGLSLSREEQLELQAAAPDTDFDFGQEPLENGPRD